MRLPGTLEGSRPLSRGWMESSFRNVPCRVRSRSAGPSHAVTKGVHTCATLLGPPSCRQPRLKRVAPTEAAAVASDAKQTAHERPSIPCIVVPKGNDAGDCIGWPSWRFSASSMGVSFPASVTSTSTSGTSSLSASSSPRRRMHLTTTPHQPIPCASCTSCPTLGCQPSGVSSLGGCSLPSCRSLPFGCCRSCS